MIIESNKKIVNRQIIENYLPSFSLNGRKRIVLIETPSSIRPIARNIFYRPNASKYRIGHDIVPNITSPPYDVALLATYLLSMEYDAVVLDANAIPFSLEEITSWILKTRPDFVIIHASDNTFLEDLALTAFIEGIGIPCIYWDEILAPYRIPFIRDNFRFVKRILGEEPELNITKLLQSENNHGLICLNGGSGIDLNSLPTINFNLLPMGRYTKWGKRFWQTFLMRGCAWGKCTYCLQARESRQKNYRVRNIEHLGKELNLAINNYGVEHVSFLSYEINPSLHYFEQLIALMSSYKAVTWEGFIRADHFNPQMISKARKSGCVELYIGVENVNSSIIKGTKKDIVLNNVKKLFHLCNRAGIRATAMVVIGTPEETEDTIKETIKFLKTVNPWAVVPAYLRVFPGTPIEKIINKDKIEYDYLQELIETKGRETGVEPGFINNNIPREKLQHLYFQLKGIGKNKLQWYLAYINGFFRQKRLIEEVLVRLLKLTGKV